LQGIVALSCLGFKLARRKAMQVAIGADREKAPGVPRERQIALEHLK
jgi:hypothetical protein